MDSCQKTFEHHFEWLSLNAFAVRVMDKRDLTEATLHHIALTAQLFPQEFQVFGPRGKHDNNIIIMLLNMHVNVKKIKPIELM